MQQGDFRSTSKAIYRVTEEGRRVAKWHLAGVGPISNASQINLSTFGRPSTESSRGITSEVVYGPGSSTSTPATISSMMDATIHRRISTAERLRRGYQAGERVLKTESHSEKLKHILSEPALRSLFREYLKGNYCEENLSFWLAVDDFKKRFNTSSTVVAANPGYYGSGASHLPTSRSPNSRNGGHSTPTQAAMEQHHETLIKSATAIFNEYLVPRSPHELNIDHTSRNELIVYLGQVLNEAEGRMFEGRLDPEQASALTATQLRTVIRLYERISQHVFRLMATDSVPKVSFSRIFFSRSLLHFLVPGDGF